MYRCKNCGRNTDLRQPKRTIVKYREVKDAVTGAKRKEIAKEVPVCTPCADLLTTGVQVATYQSTPDSEA